ncbi:MAG: hypothetical protein J0H61_07580 [Alphaproteobacteria bacterium]|nr:hypothetical protein [Alphaproteobacteria bacterium]
MFRGAIVAGLLLSPLVAAAQPAAVPQDRPPFKTSFDCAKATSNLLRMVCNDKALAALDLQAAALLKRARAKATTPDAVNEEQDLWLSQRASCRSAACLSRAYRDRIAQLHAWVD